MSRGKVFYVFHLLTKMEEYKMNTNSLITEVFTDIESGKFEKANAILADDFRALLLGKEVNRPVYISAFRSLRQGIPDLKLTIQNVKSEGAKVTAKLRITGTNSHSIPALLKGWHEIPATNKKVDGLMAELEITLKDGRIEEIRNVKNTRGMFVTLLENLGLDYKKFQEN
jgi:predicted ester cyclase